MTEWKWAKANEKDLAKFVNQKALELFPKLSVNRFDCLQSWDGRQELVEDIYKVLITQDIRYAFEKYQPEAETQQIRTPAEILSKPGEGTCLDLSLLFCSLCFACDLLPLLIVIEGHALAAVSLNLKREEWNGFAAERSLFDTPELFKGAESLAKLQKLINDDAYIAIECTGFAHTQTFNSSDPEAVGRNADGVLSFKQAVSAGKKQLSYEKRPFQFAIDIAVAQYAWKVEPLDIPNFGAAKARAKALFNVEVDQQQGGSITGVEADEMTGKVDVEANVKVNKANQTDIKGAKFGSL